MAYKKRRRLKTWLYFPLTVIVIAIATFIYAFVGRKTGLPSADNIATPTPTVTETPTPSNTPQPEAKRLFAYYDSGKWGFKSETGIVKIEAQYNRVQSFSEGLAFVGVENGNGTLYKLINKDGNDVMNTPLYEDARPHKNGMAAVFMNGLWGFVNADGTIAVQAKYESVGDFSEDGLAWVVLNGNYGYIDTAGNEVISPQYSIAQDFSGGLAFVGLKNTDATFSYYIIATDNTTVKPIGSVEGKVYSQGLAAVRLEDGTYTYYDTMGRQKSEGLVFEQAKNYSEGFAAVKQDGKWGYISLDGTTSTTAEQTADNMQENSVQANTATTGNTFVIQAIYEDAEPFSEGLAAVKLNGKWGYIDQNGNEVYAPQFDSVEAFSDGFAMVTSEKNVLCIDTEGAKKELYTLSPQDIATGIEIKGKIVTTTGNANVRKGAGTDQEIVAAVPNGTEVTVLETVGEWYKVILNSGVTGYVKQDLVTLDSAVEVTPSTSPEIDIATETPASGATAPT